MTTLKLGRKQLNETPEQQAQRLRVWRHNSFIGHAAMMQKQVAEIQKADSTTDLAKELATRIAGLSQKLEKELRRRVDTPAPAT